MVSKSVKINYKGHALRIVVGLLMLALFFAYNASALTLPVNASGGAENMPVQTAASGDVNITKIGHFGGSIVLNGTVTGKVIDYESGIPLVNVSGQSATGLMTWTASNFPAFWHEDGISGETLSVNQDDLSESQRVINRDNLVYSSTKRVVPYKIYTETGLAVWNGLDSNGSRVISGGYYAKVGWLGKPYVAVNGQAFKLSEIILEQNSTDLKNLNVNETWNLGEDHNLTLIALDKNARHAFFNLSNKSGIISEFIVEEGNSNTVWRNLADESDAPFFVTYIDNLSENSVRLKYTWLISDNVTIFNSADRFGIMEVRSYNSDGFSLSNENPITLSRGSTVNLLGSLDLVVNDSPLLEYYPRIQLISPQTDIVSQYAGLDGIVQRVEAVKAVRDYFNKLITKEDAVKVVRAYFRI